MSDQATSQSAKSPEQAIREALQKLADALSDASGLDVVTSIQILDPNDPTAKALGPIEVARTDIKIDGDRNLLVPVLFDTGDLRVPQAVYELHESNVKESLEYRRDMLQMLADYIKSRKLG